MRTLYTMLNFLFFICFIIHILFILYYSIYSKIPENITFNKELPDVSFPILFKICLFETEDNYAKFREFGYEGVYNYFRGESMFNKSIIGWAGHTENGSVITTVKG